MAEEGKEQKAASEEETIRAERNKVDAEGRTERISLHEESVSVGRQRWSGLQASMSAEFGLSYRIAEAIRVVPVVGGFVGSPSDGAATKLAYSGVEDEISAEEYEVLVEALRKINDGLDTPEHHLAYVRERLTAARAAA